MRTSIVALLAFLCASTAAFGQRIYERQRVTTVIGQYLFDAGLNQVSEFYRPTDVAFDTAGNMYVADLYNHVIRKITPAKVVTTLAGSPGQPGTTDGTGSAARFLYPECLTVDGAGNVYVADTSNDMIRKITPGGVVTTVAGQRSNNGGGPSYQDGPGSVARFNQPRGIVVDKAGNLYVADTSNDCIRKITPDGNVSTFAGMPQALHSGSWDPVGDGVGHDAWLHMPQRITMAPNGDMYFTERIEGHIRKVTPSAVVTTIAGNPDVGSQQGYIDGPGSVARFDYPIGIAMDPTGVFYVSDSGYIRKIALDGFVTTAAGRIPGDRYIAADGVGAGVSVGATGLVFGPNGALYLADATTSTIRSTAPVVVPQVLDISTRLQVHPGDNVLIGGFIVGNAASKKVLIRAIGPSLNKSGIGAALADPVLELHDYSGKIVASNDDWKATQESEIAATGVAPENDRESAIIATVEPALPYTAVVRGKGGDTGVALVEVYDLESTSGSVLANISTRGLIGSAENVMIGGFLVGPAGGTTTQFVVRALGPSLASSGVQNPIQDPMVEVRNADGALVASNNDWKSDPQTQFSVPSYLWPRDSRESVLYLQLPAGTYTAIVRDSAEREGVGLLEIYNLD